MPYIKLEEKSRHRLLKTLGQVSRYWEFEQKIISCFKWYALPWTWTRKELRDFYYNNGGK
jgi:hypothetical protein